MINSWEEALEILARYGDTRLQWSMDRIDWEEAERRFGLYEEAVSYVLKALEFPEEERDFVEDWIETGDWVWPTGLTLSNLQAELNERFEEIAELDNPAAAEEA